MGNRIIIKNADFSASAVRQETIYKGVFNDIDWANGYTSNNTNPKAQSLYGRTVGDYNYALAAGRIIVGIKCNIKDVNAGVLQVGVVREMSEVASVGNIVSVPDLLDIVELQNIHVTKTGVQTLMLPEPITLGDGDWIGVGNLTIENPNDQSIIPTVRHYLGHSICYVNGQVTDVSKQNTIQDTYENPSYNDFAGIDYIYEE